MLSQSPEKSLDPLLVKYPWLEEAKREGSIAPELEAYLIDETTFADYSTENGSCLVMEDLTVDYHRLSDYLRISQVKSLSLIGTGFGSNELAILSPALPGTQISSLTIEYSDMKQIDIDCLMQVLPDTSITTLKLIDIYLGDDQLKVIADVAPKTKLTSLDLSYNDFGNDGLIALAEALPQTQLTELNLSRTEIWALGATALAKALPDTKLVSLGLFACKVCERGGSALVAMIPYSKLTTLDFRNNYVDDKLIDLLALLLPRTKLESLDLSFVERQGNKSHMNEIDDDDCKALVDVLPQTRLTSLCVNEGKLNPQILQSLQQQIDSNRLKIGMVPRALESLAWLSEEDKQNLPYPSVTKPFPESNNKVEQSIEFAAGIYAHLPPDIRIHCLSYLPHMNPNRVLNLFAHVSSKYASRFDANTKLVEDVKHEEQTKPSRD